MRVVVLVHSCLWCWTHWWARGIHQNNASFPFVTQMSCCRIHSMYVCENMSGVQFPPLWKINNPELYYTRVGWWPSWSVSRRPRYQCTTILRAVYSFLTISIESMDFLEVLTPSINTKNNSHTIEMYPDELAEQAANEQQDQNEEHPFSSSSSIPLHFTANNVYTNYESLILIKAHSFNLGF